MQLSRYLKAWPIKDNPGHHLIFSTRRASCVMLESSTWNDLQQSIVDEELRDALVELEILVEDIVKEKKEVHTCLEQINRLKTNLNVSIIMGLQCNFACPYCYEGSMKGSHAMSDATADQTIAFIKSRFRPGLDKLVLNLYGGETLLYAERIKYLSRELKPFCEQQGAEFEMVAVTNGSLLTPKMVESLKPYGLTYAKVTVDGPAENHNKQRPFKNGQPSFDLIIDNLVQVCDLIDIGIGGNYTEENHHLFPQLLDYLMERGLTPEKLARVKFDPVMKTSDKFSLAEFHGGCASMDEEWLVDVSLQIRQAIKQRGYEFPDISPAPCAIDVDDTFTIHYDGGLYKCAALVGHEQYKVGDIHSGINDFSDSHCLGHWKQEEKCRDCVYLPLCFGGCRYMEFQRSGSMDKVDCQKEYLDATLEEILLQDLRANN